MLCLVAQSCLTLCDPMGRSPPGSSVHGILQARILEWVVIPFSRVIFPTQGLNLGLLHGRQILYCLGYQRSLQIILGTCIEFPGRVSVCAHTRTLVERVCNLWTLLSRKLQAFIHFACIFCFSSKNNPELPRY